MPDACNGASVCVRIKVKNIGHREGVEVPQLYLGMPAAAGEPKYQLRGFERLPSLLPGHSSWATFPLYERDLQFFQTCDSVGWTTPSGKFDIHVGSSSRDFRVTTSFAVCDGKILSDP